MAKIPDFTETELWVVESALEERYGKQVKVEVAEAEVKLDPGSDALTPCPTLYWQEGGVGFVIYKVAESRYRCLFFYSVHDQYGTDREEYDDLAECVSVLLKLEADTEKERAGAVSGATGEGLSSAFSQFVDF